MKNSIVIVFISLLMLGSKAYAQDSIMGVQYSRIYIDTEFDIKKVFHKETGARVTEKEYKKLKEEYPNLYLEKEINEEGKITRYFYDPNEQTKSNAPRMEKSVSLKDGFPNFKVTTIDQKKIDLKDLRGKLVILRFELYVMDFRFKKHEIKELDEKINALKNKEDVQAIIIFDRSENDVRRGFDLVDSNFELVASGHNFTKKYGIDRFPLTLLIDQNGNFIERYSYSEDIVLEEHLKN